MKNLHINLLTVGVVSIPKEMNKNEVLNKMEFFISPGEDSGLNFTLDSGSHYSFTNDYWKLIPDLEKRCDSDQENIWQQIIWEFDGEFEVPLGMAVLEVVKKIGWELELEIQYDQVEMIEFFWHVVSVEELD
jgi:hypothetical protein